MYKKSTCIYPISYILFEEILIRILHNVFLSRDTLIF